MLPFQYRENKINSIRFRNVSTINRKFYILIEPLNTNLTEQNQQQLQNESNYKQFSSQTTQLCLNPNFELDEESSEFLEQFESLSTCNNQLITLISSLVDVLIKLRALHDPQFKVDFHVNFQNLELIARDMSQVREYDFELVVFKFENLFYTTNALFHKLQETNLINMSIQDIRAKFYKKKDNEQQIPTLAFMTKFNKLMIGISQYKTLKSDNKRYQLTLQDKMQQLHELKSQKLDRIKQLKQQIEDKKKLIESKRVKNFEVSTNQKKIDRFATEKLSEGKYYQEVFKAFKTKLIDDTKNSQQKFLNSDLCKVIYLQRQTKCLFELFQIFFTPEAMKLYSGLKYFTTNSQLRNKYLDSQKYEIKLSVALGQIVQVVMHLNRLYSTRNKSLSLYTQA
eukprot:403335625